MILTGMEIKEAWERQDITIDPFRQSDINPNSYNYHLSDEILTAKCDGRALRAYRRIRIPKGGLVLNPRNLYLAATDEVIGSTKYVTTLLGRSSLGRLGLFLNITADLGHSGSASQWTLELSVIQPLRLYPQMCIGQIAFWEQQGIGEGYRGEYHKDLGPVPNRDVRLLRPEGESMRRQQTIDDTDRF